MLQSKSLPEYTTLADKEKYFNRTTIDTEEDLKLLMQKFSSTDNYRFRTVENARYKMFSSAQRQWILDIGDVKRIKSQKPNLTYKGLILDVGNKIRKSGVLQNLFPGIEITDPFIFATMQHYGFMSPLIDFAYNFEASLFFCLPFPGDKSLDVFVPSGTIDDYFSVYVIDGNNPYFDASAQKVEIDGLERADSMLKDLVGRVDTREVECKAKKLAYEDILDLPFIPIDGPAIGKQTATLKYSGFSADYIMNNPRCDAQYGLFINNNTENSPLEILTRNIYSNPIIDCYDINKSLRQYIIDNILVPANINTTTVYLDEDPLTEKIKNGLRNVIV